jgi:uncharacterized damage-inducible protein DinB
MLSLKSHLQDRARSAYRRLRESLTDLTAADADKDARPDWRRYRFGTGLDGSITGIVRHLAVWKHAAAHGLRSGVFPDAELLLPDALTGDELLAWLDAGHEALAMELARLPEEELANTVAWEGHSMPVHILLAHMIEHDQYHAGQINLLRQQWGHDLG